MTATSLDAVMARMEGRLEKIVSEWVKAAMESSLGQLGTVGALAVESFWSKLKEAVKEATSVESLGLDVAAVASSSSAAVVGAPVPGSSGSVVAGGSAVTSGVPVSGSVAGSRVPSAFGDASSVQALEVPAVGAATVQKPGNYLQDHM